MGLSAILDIAPRVSKIYPKFEHLQRSMAAKDTLSIGIYIRTDDAETYKPMQARSTWSLRHRFRYFAPILCALQLEHRWAAGFSHVTWFVASNSLALRQDIVKEFDESKSGGRTVEIMTTKGHHTAKT